MKAKFLALGVLIAVATSQVSTAMASQAPVPAGPTFDVVSIKRNTTETLNTRNVPRPDGGIAITNFSVQMLVQYAYPDAPGGIIGLPAWASTERYDVAATASLSREPTNDERTLMMRAMLSDRFKLVAHTESREPDSYNLVLARSDRRLGPKMKPVEIDCAAKLRVNRVAQECTMRRLPTGWQGATTMALLTTLLRPDAGRRIVDRTGLAGYYSVSLEYDRAALTRPPSDAARADAGPSIFTAVQEQLGLQLESSRASGDALVIDSIDHPTEN